MTPDEIDALDEYTPAQHVKRIDYLLANGLAGTSYTMRGRSFTHPSIESLMELRKFYDVLVGQEAGGNAGPFDGVSLARFGNPR